MQLTKSILLSLGFLTSIQSNADVLSECSVSATKVAPYYSTSVTNIQFENFDFLQKSLQKVFSKDSTHITTEVLRSPKDAKRIQNKISKDTLVKLIGSANPKSQYIQIEVLTPEIIYSRMKKVSEQKQFVKSGDTGLINKFSLQPIDSTFALIADGDIQASSNQIIFKGTIATPSMIDSEKMGPLFQTLVCDSKTFYKFYIYQPDQIYSAIYLDPTQDGAGFSPIYQKHLEGLYQVQKAIKDLYQFELNTADIEMDYRGFIRLPKTNEVDSHGISGYAFDKSFVHYQGGDPWKSDTWGTPKTIIQLMTLAQEWSKICRTEGCTLQVGDIAFATGALNYQSAKRGGKKDALMHATHIDGKCIDLRAFRKDDQLTGVVVSNNRKSAYDRKKTQSFIEFAQKFGATRVIYGDKKITRVLEDVELDSLHRDHIHICF